jgi:hypothetical protein
MNPSIHFKTTTLLFFIALALACFALSPRGQATDLGSVLPNHNTADGSGVLTSLTTGQNKSGFGLVAEEAAEVNPDLVVRDKNGETYTVRYDAVNAMLLNEFLKEHRKVEQQGRTIHEQGATIAQLKSAVAQQQKGMEALTATVKEQAAQIQKVSAQFELNKAEPQTVGNNQ